MATAKKDLAPNIKEYLKTNWDLIVIGGGPAGMMSAIVAAEKGKKVLILEKNEKLGKKLLITGGGRCNMTNATFDDRNLLKKYGQAEQYLYSAFSQFSVKETINFFEKEGLHTKTEAENRVFPITDKAQSVWDVLVYKIRSLYIQVASNTEVTGLSAEDGVIRAVSIKTGIVGAKTTEKLFAKKVIVATGGLSHPETGSTGDGFKWLETLGHKIIKPSVSLVPVAIQDAWVKKLQGVTLSDIKLTVVSDDYSKKIKKQKPVKGRLLFTHFGITGPTILNMSKSIADLLEHSSVYVYLDIMPEHDHGELNSLLQKIFDENKNKQIKNALAGTIHVGIIQTVLDFAQIKSETMCNSVTRQMRMNLIDVIKGLKMEVKGLLGEDKAVVSSGGVDINEIDFKTMESKIVSGLYLVGDVINIDRPSGGYSLQLCWTTGYVAGMNV